MYPTIQTIHIMYILFRTRQVSPPEYSPLCTIPILQILPELYIKHPNLVHDATTSNSQTLARWHILVLST